MKSPIHRLLLALLAACFGVAAVRASVVQADLTALARANSALVGLTSAGALQRSTDGGSTFTTTRAAGGTALFNAVAAADVVVAVGDAGLVVRSTNGGQTWSEAASPAFTGELHDAASNGTFWVAVGRSNLNVTALWSDNGGASWTSGTVPALAGALRGVTYDASAGRWTAVGTDGILGARILTSTDGKSWVSVTPPVGTAPLTDVAANGQGNLLAVGEGGTLLTSGNGGLTFSTDASSGLVTEDLNVVIYSSTGSWTAGGKNLVQVGYTTGGGAVVSQSPVPGGGDIVAVALDANDDPIIAGSLAGYQTISFDAPGDQSLSAGSLTLTATASSGLPVTFELVTGPASLDGTIVTFTGTGVVTVRALQAGNATYNAAASVERSFTITASGMSYASWQLENFSAGELNSPEISGPHAVASADGLPNLLKYALGLSAKTPASSGLPEVTITATHYVYTYTRPADRPDLAYLVEVSTGLTEWSNIAPELFSTQGSTEIWRAIHPLSSSANAFFRLRIERGMADR